MYPLHHFEARLKLNQQKLESQNMKKNSEEKVVIIKELKFESIFLKNLNK